MLVASQAEVRAEVSILLEKGAAIYGPNSHHQYPQSLASFILIKEVREEESEGITMSEREGEGEEEEEGSLSAHLSSSSLFLVLFFTSIPLHNNHRFSAGTEWLTIGSPSLAPGISSSVICTGSGSTLAHCDEVDGCAMVLECVEELYGKKKFRFKDEFE